MTAGIHITILHMLKLNLGISYPSPAANNWMILFSPFFPIASHEKQNFKIPFIHSYVLEFIHSLMSLCLFNNSFKHYTRMLFSGVLYTLSLNYPNIPLLLPSPFLESWLFIFLSLVTRNQNATQISLSKKFQFPGVFCCYFGVFLWQYIAVVK